MTITRDADFPPEIAQLVQAFSRCANGHDMSHVFEAAGNMFSASIHNFAAALGMSDEDAMSFAHKACLGVLSSVQLNWKRKPEPTDIQVNAQ